MEAGGSKLIKSDLKVISVFMVVVIILNAAYHATNEVTPEMYAKPEEEDEENGGNETAPIIIDIEVLSTNGQTSEGQTSTETFDLVYTMVTQVEIGLVWTDDYGNNDEFRVVLEWEGEEIDSDSSTSGNIYLRVTDEPDGGLIGNFTVRIEAVNCPGIIGPFIDNGNTWQLVVNAKVSEDDIGEVI